MMSDFAKELEAMEKAIALVASTEGFPATENERRSLVFLQALRIASRVTVENVAKAISDHLGVDIPEQLEADKRLATTIVAAIKGE